jgi:hypothetical protein
LALCFHHRCGRLPDAPCRHARRGWVKTHLRQLKRAQPADAANRFTAYSLTFR